MHADVLPPAQQSVLRHLGPIATKLNFYLGGGTAAAIQIGHRQSVDLDWFTQQDLPDPLAVAEHLRTQAFAIEIESVEEGTLHAEADHVPVSFLEYRYPVLRPLAEWPEYNCRLASLEDLARMTLSALAGRGAKKDFIDIYALGRHGPKLAEMLDLYRQKYQTRDIGHVIMSLTYFDDAEPDEMPTMLWDIDWAEIKRTIQGWVVAYTRRQGASGP